MRVVAEGGRLELSNYLFDDIIKVIILCKVDNEVKSVGSAVCWLMMNHIAR